MSSPESDAPAPKPVLRVYPRDTLHRVFLIGRARLVAQEAGWSLEKWESVCADARSGDAAHALEVLTAHFNLTYIEGA